MKRLTAALTCLFALSACAPRFEEAKTDPVTSPPPTPSPASVERPRDMAGQITHEVRRDAEGMLGGPTPGLDVQCAYSSQSKFVPCTARYQGHEVTFNVELHRGGSALVKLDITAERRFLSRADVHRKFYETLVREEDGEPPAADDQVRCDKMPEMSTIPVKPGDAWTDTGVRCYHYDNVTDVREVWTDGVSQLSFVTEDEAKRRDWK
ncbi:hypothetical protein [Amycolatopsis suaedae]|uniref:DUF3558 domain-containing protein n=1 Tax=Amycolatopsis suaedae TaxID=2510978 RepID=A0A4Q7JBE4_9PSEU|nr:hypothetical protein [Amycolatopsis suaedae]RZQ65141.1 hypothetical protein EWH70_04395 [Amycolatopsis suaedae]